MLEPDDAAVIFDADRFRVDIFVNPELLDPQLAQAERFQPAPEAGFSALETISAAVAGSTSDGTDFTLRSHSLLAYDTGRLTAETSVSSADDANLDVLAAEADRHGWRYTGGLYRTALSSLLGERRLLGAGAGSTTDTRLDREQIGGSPIVVFLPSRAQVEIFREGRLLSSQSYPAGNQVVDTTALPEGAYEVTLRIRQIDGSVREETRFFAKTSAVPPRGAPRYVLEAGLVGNEGDGPADFADNGPAVHGGTTHRLTESLALGSDLICGRRQPALSSSAPSISPRSAPSRSARSAPPTAPSASASTPTACWITSRTACPAARCGPTTMPGTMTSTMFSARPLAARRASTCP